MNAATKKQIKINRQNAQRTLVADRSSMTGVTSDGIFVEYCFALRAWVDETNMKPVSIARINYISIKG